MTGSAAVVSYLFGNTFHQLFNAVVDLSRRCQLIANPDESQQQALIGRQCFDYQLLMTAIGLAYLSFHVITVHGMFEHTLRHRYEQRIIIVAAMAAVVRFVNEPINQSQRKGCQ